MKIQCEEKGVAATQTLKELGPKNPTKSLSTGWAFWVYCYIEIALSKFSWLNTHPPLQILVNDTASADTQNVFIYVTRNALVRVDKYLSRYFM